MTNRFRKKIFPVILSITFLCGCAPSNRIFSPSGPLVGHEAALVEERSLRETASAPGLKVGERLVYHVKWLLVHAGEIIAEVKGVEEVRGRKAYRIEVTARTVGICSKIYRVEDRFVSFLDVDELHTLRHEAYRREGRYAKDAVTDFDQENHKAFFVNFTDNTRKTYDIPPHVQDTITAAYYARLLPLEPGRSFALQVANCEKVYDLFIHVPGRVRTSALNGPLREAFEIRPYARLAGEEVREGKVSGFVAADGTREPLLVTIRAPVFTQVTARLAGGR
jgi:hypothetical protein